MDSYDEEMLTALMEEEADGATADDEEHLQMLACLAGLYAADAQPKRGGSAPIAKRASNDSVRKAIACCTPTTLPTIHCTVR